MKLPKLTYSEQDKRHPMYNTWWNMIARCYIKAAPGYIGYGGRGISVCKEWHNFAEFVKFTGSKKIKGMTTRKDIRQIIANGLIDLTK